MKDTQETPTHPAIHLANDRPSCSFKGSEDTLMDWAIDAEDMLRKLVEQNEELLAVLPDLDCVISWLMNGCDPKEAAKELQLYKIKIDAAKLKATGQTQGVF